MSKPALEKLCQIGILVNDLEATVKNYEALGIGPWEITVMNNDTGPFKDLTFNGQDIEPKGDVLRVAMLHRFGMEIELIQPVANSVYKDWLEEHGPGLHHLAFLTRDSYDEVLETYKEKTGKETWVRGQGFGGKMDFSYLDLRDELGLIIECYGDDEANKDGLDY